MKGQRKAFLEYFPENYDYDEDDGDGIHEDDGNSIALTKFDACRNLLLKEENSFL